MASRRSTRASASRNDAPAALPEQGEAPNMKPRRRREQSEASAFLSKTYAMINGLDGTVGGWSDAGDSMVILDAENFASEVIPQYFKHNNFRSFVRQLNFYGFRKLRADPSAGPSTPPRWEFKHVNFRRGRPELLVQIRRAEHYDYASPDVAASTYLRSQRGPSTAKQKDWCCCGSGVVFAPARSMTPLASTSMGFGADAGSFS